MRAMDNFESDPVAALKQSFRQHASGVSVITMLDPAGQQVGFTATSMTSLGANPPLASFNVACGASAWSAISSAKFVAIHTLGARNLELAKRMAADHTKRFETKDWTTGPEGLPIFEDATSVLICRVRELHPVESNAVVIVEIIGGMNGEPDRGLLYHQRGYSTPGEQLESAV